MACRHLNIHLLENGDVKYHFFRHHAKYAISRYRIDWPACDVEILDGQNLETDNFKIDTSNPRCVILNWDKVPESDAGARELTYIKRRYLRKLDGSTPVWKYEEVLRIKPDFGLWLHGPIEKLSALKSRSSAVFHGNDGSVKSYLPRELTEAVFHTEGKLHVKWELEVVNNT